MKNYNNILSDTLNINLAINKNASLMQMDQERKLIELAIRQLQEVLEILFLSKKILLNKVKRAILCN